ncbi:hypothetical protein LENED_009901 [Lentinula edodes]|uniref:Uncharacterized protein n=1 Tax=Lentinula edodes TaxID=5353 RepID=A0A1Q3EL02_LENED|nr:hypothetical protein LENED_009901 [Lentinula edodes]
MRVQSSSPSPTDTNAESAKDSESDDDNMSDSHSPVGSTLRHAAHVYHSASRGSSTYKANKADTMKAKVMGKMRAKSDLFRAAQAESNGGYKKRRIELSPVKASSSKARTSTQRPSYSKSGSASRTLSTSKSKIVSSSTGKGKSMMKYNGMHDDYTLVSRIIIAPWDLTHDHLTNTGQQIPYPRLIDRVSLTDVELTELEERHLAFSDTESGMRIDRKWNTTELLDFIATKLPNAMRYIQLTPRVVHTVYNRLLDDKKYAFFSPVVLCLKDGRTWKAYPGKAGNWPDGELVRLKCVSKRNYGWEDNWIVLCARCGREELMAAGEQFMVGLNPSPPPPTISDEDDETSGRQDKGKGRARASSKDVKRDARRLRENRPLFLSESSESSDGDNPAADAGYSSDDYPGTTEAITASLGQQNRPTTRAMSQRITSTSGSTSAVSTDLAILDLTSDSENEDNVVSTIAPGHPDTSPLRPDWVAKANSTSFIVNDKISGSVFNSAGRIFKF